MGRNSLTRTSENGSLSSVQSSGSDSSLSADRANHEVTDGDQRVRGSPVWKRKAQVGELAAVGLNIVQFNQDGTCRRDFGGLGRLMYRHSNFNTFFNAMSTTLKMWQLNITTNNCIASFNKFQNFCEDIVTFILRVKMVIFVVDRISRPRPRIER